MPLHLVQGQIQTMKRLTHNAPLYVLGPLTTDSAPGYDHITGAIGGALAAQAGADFLCYVTPAEHLTLPGLEDVRQGVMASRIAAQSAEVALGSAQAAQRDLDMSKARKNLDWEAMAGLALDPAMVPPPPGAVQGREGMRHVRQVLRHPHGRRNALARDSQEALRLPALLPGPQKGLGRDPGGRGRAQGRDHGDPSAPARKMSAALASVIPPMATSGRRVARRMARSPSRPRTGPASGLVSVGNTGPAP